MSKSVYAIALLASVGAAQAQITVPSGVTESASISGLNTAIRSAPREHMSYYNPSVISSSGIITGIQLRLAIGENWRPAGYSGSSWPSQNLTLGSFKITLAKPATSVTTAGEFLSSSVTFASQMASPVVVFNGTLTIPAGSFTADGGAASIHSWAPVINFTTNYNLTSTDGLIVYIAHTGYTPSAELNAFFASDTYTPNSRDAISNVGGTTGSANGFSSPYFYNLVTVPAPASIALLGMSGLLATRRRRA